MATRPMQVWNGTAWEDIGPQAPATAIVVQSSTPTGDSGKLWIDTSADVPTYASMAPTASPSFTGTSTFAGPVTMSGGSVSMSGATSVTGGGMDLITPTSVAGSGVTMSGGAISFSAATTVSANGVFTSVYDNYLFQMSLSATTSTDASLFARMRLSGSDAATTYSGSRVYGYGTTIGASLNTSSGTTSWFIGQITSSNAQTIALSVDLFKPALAQETAGFNRCVYIDSSGNHFNHSATLLHRVATAYDGLTVYPASGSMTGTLRIYGLRNS